jgi:hypothetical protein
VVPLFGDRNDQVAMATLAELFPQHKIVGIENSREILLGGGNVACITMPQYAGAPNIKGCDDGPAQTDSSVIAGATVCAGRRHRKPVVNLGRAWPRTR